MVRRGVPKHPLAAFQLVEYLRAFFVRVGGCKPDTIGEDMELVVRLHRVLSRVGLPHNIDYLPNPVCWTEAPEDLKAFASRRVRWHRGPSESLYLNRGLLFSRDGGAPGWVAFPFFLLCEWPSPFMEVAGYLFSLYLLAGGNVSHIDASLVLLFAVSLSVFLSTVGLLLDEITLPGTIKLWGVLCLSLFSVLECFGYRQLNMYYKIKGAIMWITNRRATWGTMTRKGAWQS